MNTIKRNIDEESDNEDIIEKKQRIDELNDLITQTTPIYSMPIFIIRMLQTVNTRITKRFETNKHHYIYPIYYGESKKINHKRRLVILLNIFCYEAYKQFRKIENITNILNMLVTENLNLVPQVKKCKIKKTRNAIAFCFIY